MDLSDLIILLLFLLPLLQHLLERMRGSSAPEEKPPEEEAEMRREAAPDARQDVPLGWPPPPRDEPLGWPPPPREWTEDAAEELASLEVASEEEAAELAALQEEMPAHLAPEAVRVSTPVVSLESLHVDRRAEHARFHARGAPAVMPPRSHVPRLATLLHGSGDLRRAILLTEVLGPPRSLQ